MTRRFHLCAIILTLATAVTFLPLCSRAAEPAAPKAEETNTLETLRSYLQLQEQIHAAQVAIEQNRKEAAEAAARNAETLVERLNGIEKSLSAQRARELEVMQASNRVMLIVAGAFAVLGLCAMVLMAWFQARAVSRLAEISASLPALRGPALSFRAGLGMGDSALSLGPVEQSNLRLLGALEKLEKRMFQLETASRLALPGSPENRNGAGQGPASSPGASLLARGQSLLDEDKVQEALACFDEATQLGPTNPEAWVKKGAALERLGRSEAALECYDKAIGIDDGCTIAYLYKAGLHNRLQHFPEALACYEQALRTHEKKVA